MEVIPGMPNPNSGKIYDLQIGSFSSPEAAAKVVKLVRDAGFNVIQKPFDYHYRVLVIGIPAASVYSVLQRLGTLGIGQVLIRE
jgi:cell division septation protein DedD